jgi:hypothetical protein
MQFGLGKNVNYKSKRKISERMLELRWWVMSDVGWMMSDLFNTQRFTTNQTS